MSTNIKHITLCHNTTNCTLIYRNSNWPSIAEYLYLYPAKNPEYSILRIKNVTRKHQNVTHCGVAHSAWPVSYTHLLCYRPISVPQLIHVGVMRIACGDCHCVALTLTGQCFMWGKNDCGQVKTTGKGIDQSSPCVWGHAKQAALGSRHSLLLATDNTLHWLGKDRLVIPHFLFSCKFH